MAKCFGVIAELVVTGVFAGRCPVTAPGIDFGQRLMFGEGGRPQKTMVCPTGQHSRRTGRRIGDTEVFRPLRGLAGSALFPWLTPWAKVLRPSG
jgi:hypothetical protein